MGFTFPQSTWMTWTLVEQARRTKGSWASSGEGRVHVTWWNKAEIQLPQSHKVGAGAWNLVVKQW